MASSPYSEAWISHRIAEGRGQGEGRHYKPWILIGRREFPSRGRSHICPGAKCRRSHYFLSNLEKWVWLILEWSAVVVDIREQFPLFPRQVCWQIANDLGIRHPYDAVAGTPRILTTDFLVSLADTDCSLLALSAKYEAELEEAEASMLARLELERRFWEHFGISWRLVTERDIPHPLAENLEWLVDCKTLPRKLSDLTGVFIERLGRICTLNVTLQAAANQAAVDLELTESEALSVLCHLIWQRQVTVDLNEKLSPSSLLAIVPAIAADAAAEGIAS